MRVIAFILLLFLVTACSGNDSAIPLQKVETKSQAEEFHEEDSDVWSDEEPEKIGDFLEFMIEDEVVSISITEIPILHEFIQAQKNPQQAIEGMQLDKHEVALQQFYLLQFSCYKNHCSHFILHPDKNKSAILIADMARYETFTISPDESKIAILFSRLGEQEVPLGDIVVFDLTNWSSIALINDSKDKDMLGYKFPILSVEWQSDDSIAISYPDLIEPSKEYWDAWSVAEENSKTIETFHLQTD